MPMFGLMSQSASSDIGLSEGGIKTKALGAFARVTAAIGNAAAFETWPLLNCPLQIEDNADLQAIRRRHEAHRAVLEEAECVGARYLAEWHAFRTVCRWWNQLLKGKTPSHRQDDVELPLQSTSVAADNRE